MMEFLPHDLIANIMEWLDAKTLVKFKCVSKRWKFTIQSPSFQQRQLLRTQSSSTRGDPYVLLISVRDPSLTRDPNAEALRTLVAAASSSTISVKIPTSWDGNDDIYLVCNTSCDGLVCLYDIYGKPSIVVNPITRWHWTIPECNYQFVAFEKDERDETFEIPYVSPGFGKDKFSGTYKHVWLYNSRASGINNETTSCEVFDFETDSWRYIVPASPYPIIQLIDPVYVDGSLHWLTASSPEGETMVLSLDLHTELLKLIFSIPIIRR